MMGQILDDDRSFVAFLAKISFDFSSCCWLAIYFSLQPIPNMRASNLFYKRHVTNISVRSFIS